MKRFLSLSFLFTVTLFAINLLFISCGDENNEVKEPSKILLSTMSSYRSDGTLIGKESYKYDVNGRLIEMLNSDDYKVLLDYSAPTLIVKEYDKEEISFASIFNLNDKGLCISSSENEYQTTTYTYDGNGYRQSVMELTNDLTYKETYTVFDGNYVTITTESNYQIIESAKANKTGFLERSMLLKSGASRIAAHDILKSASKDLTIEKTDFEFYTDKTNTIDLENMGITFFGKQNKNPVKKETQTLNDWPAHSINYSYKYDSKGRITKKTDDSGNYDVFTYVE